MTGSTFVRFAALSFALLIGQVTDKTTGQPLAGVHIVLQHGRVARHTVTGADGTFRLPRIPPGSYVLRYSSSDVPAQSTKIAVHGARQRIDITACSATLDYSCAGGGGGG
jgi:hypothetical protein